MQIQIVTPANAKAHSNMIVGSVQFCVNRAVDLTIRINKHMTNSFLQNKYSKWYFNIIANARLRDTVVYVEKHHIIPKSLGGQNSKDNIVSLTAKEHFICHLLLVKMVHDPAAKIKMNNAIWMMQSSSKTQERYKISSIIYKHIKERISESYRNNPNHRSPESRIKQSNTTKGKSYEERYGEEIALELRELRSKKRQPRSEETKEKLRAANIGKKRGPSKRKGCKSSDETKQKISNALKGRKLTPLSAETKQKISQTKKNQALSKSNS